MEGFISLSVPFTETSPPRTATCSVSRDMRGTGAPVLGVINVHQVPIPGGSPQVPSVKALGTPKKSINGRFVKS